MIRPSTFGTAAALRKIKRFRVMGLVNQFIEEGRTTVVYTRRERLDLNTGNAEDELKIATDISRYLTRIVEELKVKPAFIVAKGGITSSDIGVKGPTPLPSPKSTATIGFFFASMISATFFRSSSFPTFPGILQESWRN